jgi:hypothetical protein
MPYQVDPTTLTQVATNLIASGNFDPNPDGTTKCNLFLNSFAQEAFQYSGFETPATVLLANDIVDLLRSKVDGWTPLFDIGSPDLQASFQDAQNGANQGLLVVIGLKNLVAHGHVCAVVPAPALVPSGSWSAAGLPANLPVVAQAGVSVFAAKCLSYGVSPNDYDPNNFVIYVRQIPQ